MAENVIRTSEEAWEDDRAYYRLITLYEMNSGRSKKKGDGHYEFAASIRRLVVQTSRYRKARGKPYEQRFVDDEILSEVDLRANLNTLYDSIPLHTKVRSEGETLFKSGRYSEAIFQAFKTVINLLKERTMQFNLRSESELIAKAFDSKRPLLRLNPLRTTSHLNEQEGFKLMLLGAMKGIRNPRAHDTIRESDGYQAMEYLSLASLLAKRIDDSYKETS